MAKKGRIEKIGLLKVFSWIEREKLVGTLSISNGKESKYVFFNKGTLIHAHSQSPEDQLERLIVRTRLVTRQQLIVLKRRAVEKRTGLIQILFERKILTKEKYTKLKTIQAKEVTLSTFGWNKGEFVFFPQKLPSGNFVKLSVPIKEILSVARKRYPKLDKPQATSAPSIPPVQLPPMESIFTVSGAPDTKSRIGQLSSEEQDVMILFNGKRTLDDVIKKSRFPVDWTQYAVRKLLNLKILVQQQQDPEFEEAARAHKMGHFFKAHSKIQEILTQDPNHSRAKNVQTQFANDLLQDIKKKIKSLKSIPQMKDVDYQAWTSLQLDKKAGFIFSRIDGNTNLKQLIAMTKFSKGEVCMIIYELLENGLISLKVPEDSEGVKSETETFRSSVDVSEEEEAKLQKILDKHEKYQKANFYEILGVPVTANRNNIKTAFQSLSKEFHPDTCKSDYFAPHKKKIDDVFSKIALSYDTLKNDLKRSKYDEAIGVAAPSVETVRKKKTNTKAKLQYSIAQKCLQRRDWNRAIEFLRSAIDLEPDEPLYHGRLAETLARNVRLLEQAKSHCQQAIKLDPTDPYYYNIMANIARSNQDFKLALRWYYKALEVDAQNQIAIQGIEAITGKPVDRRRIPSKSGQLIIRKPERR